MNAPVKVACLQMHTVYHDVNANLTTARRMILEACENGANLLVLPEVFNVGGSGATRKDAYEVAEPVPDGKTTRMLLELAEEKQVYICGSILEQDGVDLFNTAVFVGPEGYIGRFRKLHINGGSALIVEPGDLGIPVFHTKLGRIALLVCADSYSPETFRIAALQGADIVCVVYKSMEMQKDRGLPEGWHTIFPALCMAGAVSNHIAVVGCNQVGECNGYVSAGQSTIVNHWGALLTPLAPHDREAIIYADIDLSDSRRKHFTPTSSRLVDRRVDIYDPMLGYDPKRFRRI